MNTSPYLSFGNVISPGGQLIAGQEHSHVFSVNETNNPHAASVSFRHFQLSDLQNDNGGGRFAGRCSLLRQHLHRPSPTAPLFSARPPTCSPATRFPRRIMDRTTSPAACRWAFSISNTVFRLASPADSVRTSPPGCNTGLIIMKSRAAAGRPITTPTRFLAC